MATTLSRVQTDLFFIQRVQVNESGDNGDFWTWASAQFGDTQFNNMVSNYNDYEDDADNSVLTGTHSNGTTFPISSAPSHPRPHSK